MKKFIYSSMAVAMLASFAAAQESSPVWAEKGCIAFVENGAGDYDQNCYNSGLENMAPGKCYTFNKDRGVVPQWINKFASETWWWVETECVEPPAPPEGPVVTKDKNCIAFENGLGDYKGKCFNDGLYDMTPGKCYTFIDHGTTSPWVNNRASDSWWWEETDCEETIYCAEHPETEGCPQVDPCLADPTAAGCQIDCTDPANASDPQCFVDPCLADPTAAGCQIDCNDPANFDKAQCKVDCTDPINASNPQCVDPCLADPTAAGCQIDCTDPANASDPQCVDPCLADPTAAGCQQVNPCETDVNTAECKAFCDANEGDAVCARIVDKCIDYKHGVGHYTENCYKSGLKGQVEGKCYAVNPDSYHELENSLVINDNALDAHWWYEVSCDKKLGPNMDDFEVVEKQCVLFENGFGNYAGKCFNDGLYDMTPGKCYQLREERGNPQGHINNRASDTWWWEEVECTELKPKAEPKAEPKAARKVAVEAAPLSEVKTLRVFDLNGKLLHTETFSGSVQSVDFAKFAGKGMRLVRITAGKKLVATKTVR